MIHSLVKRPRIPWQVGLSSGDQLLSMLAKDPQQAQASIQICVPDQPEFTLTPSPSTFSDLVYLISQHLSVDPAAVKLTYTDEESDQRLMLVGEQRFEQALKSMKGDRLKLTVVLVPVTDIGSPSGLIQKRTLEPCPQITESFFKTRSDSSHATPEAAKRKLRSILDNSQHYLSVRFKEALFSLTASVGLASCELDLSGAEIGAYESVLVAEMVQLVPTIRALNLKNNHISNDALATICASLLSLRELELLELADNEVSAAGARVLAKTIRKLPGLKFLSVARNQLQAEDLELIKDAAPGMCRVLHDAKSGCQLM